MKYFSMFSGIGGFELGILNAAQTKGIQQGGSIDRLSSDRSSSLASEPLCVGYSEIDKYAIQIYEKHFKGHKNYGDATRIIPKEIEDFDMLFGGFPCQSFSIAGKRGGFDDPRGKHFFEIARILQDKKPRLFLLENVKGLLSSGFKGSDGKIIKRTRGIILWLIVSTLNELGYDLQWEVLNSKNFGVPQNRERVFIIGHIRGTSRPEVFPIRENDKLLDGKIESDKGQSQAQYSTTLRGGNVKADHTFIQEKELSAKANHLSQNGRNIHDDGYAFTITQDQNDSCVGQDSKIRRFTPIECERLQGFPDGWTKGISDTQRYKCLGNAVTVNVIQAIMERLK